MNENVKKLFEMLGVSPNESFSINDDEYYYMFDTHLNLYRSDENKIDSSSYTSIRYDIYNFLSGEHKIIKLPKKKKLRDLTEVEYRKYFRKCNVNGCPQCLFYALQCNPDYDNCWFHNKEILNDKFLNQEIEVPENDA